MISFFKKFEPRRIDVCLGVFAVAMAFLFASSARGESVAYGLTEFLFEESNMVSRTFVQRDPSGSSHIGTVGQIWTGNSYHAFISAYTAASGNKDITFNGGSGVTDLNVGKRFIDFNPNDAFDFDNLCNAVATNGTHFFAACRSRNNTGYFDIHLVKFDSAGDYVSGFGSGGLVDTNIGGDGTNGQAFVRGMVYDADSDAVIIVGTNGLTGATYNPFIAKFDAGDGSQVGSTVKISGTNGTAVGVVYDSQNSQYYMAATDQSGDRNFYVHKFSTGLVEDTTSPWGTAIDFETVAGAPAGADSVPAGLALFQDVSGGEDYIIVVGGNRTDSGTPPWNCAAVAIQTSDGNLASGWGEVSGGTSDAGITLFNHGILGTGTNDCILNNITSELSGTSFFIATGTAYNAINYDMLFAKMSIATGDLDTSFDSDGHKVTSLGLADDVMNGVQFLNNSSSFVVASGRSTGDQYYGGVNVKVDTSTGALVIPPTIVLVNPQFGPDAGGTTVTITGTGFVDGSTTVSLGGSNCDSVTVNSAVELTCETTAHAAGVVDAVITVGTETGTKVDAFEYLPAPEVFSVAPSTGGTAGGTQITITGDKFEAGATVDIGGAACDGNVASDTTIQCTTTANTAGAKLVTVTNPDGQSGSLTDGFTYVASPTITNTSPAFGPKAGGTTITLTGTNFQATPTSILVAGVPCGTITFVNSTSVTCVTGAADAEGVGDVLLTNPDGIQAVDEDAFTYRDPITVTSISPNEGRAAGGDSVTIEGTGFYAGLTADIDGTTCGAPFELISSTEYRCTTGAKAAGTYDVTITNSDATNATLSNGYTYNDPPAITNVSPAVGPTAGGTTITLTGTAFKAASKVYVGGAICNNMNTAGVPTSVQCDTTASSAGTYNVRIVNDVDGQEGTDTNAFTYVGPPKINSLFPTSGRIAGGTPNVTIYGSNFVGSTVTFGATTCAIQSVATTKIVCTPGNHGVAEEDVDVIVTNSDSQTATKENGYDYRAAPTISSLDVTTGPTGGGTHVTITGTNFRPGVTVTFGTPACTNLVRNSDTELECDSPENPSGAVTVTAENTDGQTGTYNSFTYTQAAPTVTSVVANAGPTGGGTLVSIYGTSFYSGIIARFGGTLCTSPTYVDENTMTCVTPSGTGSVTVQVENLDTQTGSLPSGFTYQSAPAVASVSPNAGPIGGGQTITINGTNFSNSPSVPTVTLKKTSATTADYACGSVSFINSTQITCVTASSNFYAGVVDVEVRNADLQTGTLTDGYTYRPAPIVVDTNPAGGPDTGGTLVTITGSNFVDGATVSIGGVNCTPVIFNSAANIQCTTGARAAATVDVVVTNPVDSQVGTQTNGYTYRAAPTITSLTPATGPTTGGTTVTITGTGFATGANVDFDGAACEIDTLNATTIVCDTTAHVAGVVDVRVTNDDNQDAVKVDGFEYGREPTITSISPTRGKSSGGTLVTILGTNFEEGVTVDFDTSSCININRVSTSEIQCTTTSHAPAAVDVVVTNDTGASATATDGYVYTAAGSWNAMTNTNRPGAWSASSAVWTGSKMIVFGGYRSGIISGGKAYDPIANTWTTLATTGAPTARYHHKAVWTGTRMAIWGGQNTSTRFANGKFYNPATNTWTGSFSQGTNTPQERSAHSMAYVQDKIFVWGGFAGNVGANWTNSGAVYNITNNQWSKSNFANAPAARTGHHAFVPFTTLGTDGTVTTQANQVMVWGGVLTNGASSGTGKIYDIDSDTWFNVNPSGAPSQRARLGAVWDGSKVYIWGGWLETTGPAYNDGKIYTPSTNLWASMTTTSVDVRFGHSMVLAGDTILVWAGCTTTSYHRSGGEYDISGDSWQPTVLNGAPQARAAQHAFWANNAGVMLVWGGFGWLVEGSSWQRFLDGSRYTPR